MSSQPILQSRRQLFDYLEERMNSVYRQILHTGKMENESTHVKTYLLEFDWKKSKEKNESKYLQTMLAIPSFRKNQKAFIPTVNDTDEEGFYEVEWRKGKQSSKIYLDTSSSKNRRFWIGYSLSTAAELDSILDKVASNPMSGLDRMWLYPKLLTTVQDWGEFRGFGLDYDYRAFENERNPIDESTDYLKMQLWGGPDTKDLLDTISSAKKGRVALSKIRMKFTDNDSDRFVLEDIKYNGKFTCRGTSFSSHQVLINRMRDEYEKQVDLVESQHIITCSHQSDSSCMGGDPVFFRLEMPIENLDAFCDVVFEGTAPYHVWGLVSAIGSGRKVNAVDLHTGSRLTFEIYGDEIAMYLHPGSCGNTVLRFYTNLVRTLTSGVKVINNEQQNIL